MTGVQTCALPIFTDDAICREASKQEIIRRYYTAITDISQGLRPEEEAYKIELLMKQLHITPEDRSVVPAALTREENTGAPAAALELSDGTIITGKTSDLLGPSAALLLNALKHLAGIDHEKHVIAPSAIEPIQTLKTQYLGGHNPRLHMEEVLIALSVSASKDPVASLLAERRQIGRASCRERVSSPV